MSTLPLELWLAELYDFALDELRQELFNRSQWETKRKSETVAQIEAHYRKVMGL